MNAFLFNHAMPNIEEGDTLDIIRQAYEKLGPDKMKALDYRKKAFKDELIINNKKIANHHRVRNILNLKVADRLTKEQAKDKIIKAYNDLGIDGKPTAKDLEKYYYIEEKLIPDPKTGKRVRGLVIGAPKALKFK
jgi:hypothetical protein